MARMAEKDVLFISAQDRVNLDELRDLLYERVKAIHMERYPYNDFLF
jgi:GTP-binding protein HflX